MASNHPYSYMSNQRIDSLLRCAVCDEPFIDPVTAPDGRKGCRLCLTEDSPSQSAKLQPIEELIVLEMLRSLKIQCPQCEEINIRRGDVEKHQQNTCRRAIVSCQASDIKCPWRGAREKLDDHMDHCVFQPLRPALSELITQNKHLKEQLNKLETSVQQLRGVVR